VFARKLEPRGGGQIGKGLFSRGVKQRFQGYGGMIDVTMWNSGSVANVLCFDLWGFYVQLQHLLMNRTGTARVE
jgi:hypothetical protein